MIRTLSMIICLCAGVLLPATAGAHKPSDSYLSLTVGEDAIEGQWDIALRDLDFAIGLDRDGDGAITWGELRANHENIIAYALPRLSLSVAGRPFTPEISTRSPPWSASWKLVKSATTSGVM